MTTEESFGTWRVRVYAENGKPYGEVWGKGPYQGNDPVMRAAYDKWQQATTFERACGVSMTVGEQDACNSMAVVVGEVK